MLGIFFPFLWFLLPFIPLGAIALPVFKWANQRDKERMGKA
jgi:hypothetical protein